VGAGGGSRGGVAWRTGTSSPEGNDHATKGGDNAILRKKKGGRAEFL